MACTINLLPHLAKCSDVVVVPRLIWWLMLLPKSFLSPSHPHPFPQLLLSSLCSYIMAAEAPSIMASDNHLQRQENMSLWGTSSPQDTSPEVSQQICSRHYLEFYHMPSLSNHSQEEWNYYGWLTNKDSPLESYGQPASKKTGRKEWR